MKGIATGCTVGVQHIGGIAHGQDGLASVPVKAQFVGARVWGQFQVVAVGRDIRLPQAHFAAGARHRFKALDKRQEFGRQRRPQQPFGDRCTHGKHSELHQLLHKAQGMA
ncbi:hypothetical protein PS687_04538 [Pseudomonas fluorescens]|nr:hypothetical protein PS687_04538 [Pseudomonas fluorescens]